MKTKDFYSSLGKKIDSFKSKTKTNEQIARDLEKTIDNLSYGKNSKRLI